MLALCSDSPNKHILRAGFDRNQSGGYGGVFAYVWGNDPEHRIFLGGAFHRAVDTGKDSRVGTLLHEMSHFVDVGNTKDHDYGQAACLMLATKKPVEALNNADNFEYSRRRV